MAQQPTGWNQLCSEGDLAKIALSIVDWRAISPFLGLTEAEEIAILESTHSVPARKMAMLRKWKQKNGTEATYNKLCERFRMCELADLESKVKQILAGSLSVLPQSPTFKQQHSTSYASYLMKLYSSMSHSHTSQHWTHLPRCEFVQLAMIKDEELRRGGPEEEMVRLAQLGKIETILDHKIEISLNQLFTKYCDTSSTLASPSLPIPPLPLSPLPLKQTSHNSLDDLQPNPRTILIEGAPGGGKSTLALHICHQWARGASWLARFDVVIIAYLRDEAVQNANILDDILPARNKEMSQSIASQLQATDGSNVLFIFDGWDEFPSDLMNNSIVSTIISQPQKLSLHQSTVLITSRPVSSGNLIQLSDRRVEILGFTKMQIYEYITKALNGHSAHIQKLVQHLEEYPIIEGYCYIPLHAAILVHTFLTMKGALPTTLHMLFCDLVLCCIVRERKTREPNASLPNLSSLNELPDDIETKLSSLGELAYNGVMQNKVIFYPEDLQACHLPSHLQSFGLLQAVEGLTLTSTSLSYNFLHLSVQELLAAYCISHMSPSEQLKVFKEMFGSSRFQAVLHYFCGFTKLTNPDIQIYRNSFL